MQLPNHVQWTDNATGTRRSTRIETDVLIEVQGEGFAYAGETVRVNLHGALIRTSAPLEIGTPVRYTCIALASLRRHISCLSFTILVPAMASNSITPAISGASPPRRPTGKSADR